MSSSGKRNVLLLSVPHNEPSEFTTVTTEEGVVLHHLSDSGALPFAYLLEKTIASHTDVADRWDVEVRVGDTNRIVCDLNRIQCRRTPWRSSLREDMKHATLLIDVHSFPPEHSNLNCYFLRDDGYVAVNNEKKCSLTDINAVLHDVGVKSEVVGGSRNDIIDEAYELHVCAILLEINESNNELTNGLIANTIAVWLRNWGRIGKTAPTRGMPKKRTTIPPVPEELLRKLTTGYVDRADLYRYHGMYVLVVIPGCCDLFADAYRMEDGKRLGSPMGGFAGHGDGSMPNWGTARFIRTVLQKSQ